MSRALREAHDDGECGFFCHYCDQEEARETPVTRTSDGIDIPLPPDPDDEEEVLEAEARQERLLREAEQLERDEA